MAEDDENDSLLCQHAFASVSGWRFKHVKDGMEVVEYLSGSGQYSDRRKFPTPAMLLLDLKMPRMDGFRVLQWLRDNPPLNRLRVVVFSASAQQRDIDRACDLGASAYLLKPVSYKELKVVVGCILKWLEINQYPTLGEPSPRAMCTSGT